MTRRRRLRGKKLLVASAGMASASLFGCDDSDSRSPVANLVPPDATMLDAAKDASTKDAQASEAGTADDADTQMDANTQMNDAEPDRDASFYDGEVLVDAPIANLVPPPTDAGFGGGSG